MSTRCFTGAGPAAPRRPGPLRARVLLAALAGALLGCARAEVPTMPVSPEPAPVRAAPGAVAPSPSPAVAIGRGAWHRPVLAEAREGLGAIVTGEQSHFQRDATFVDAADIAELREELGVYLETLAGHWAFAVSGANADGFVARAAGVARTPAQGLVVTLRYERDRPPEWTLERR